MAPVINFVLIFDLYNDFLPNYRMPCSLTCYQADVLTCDVINVTSTVLQIRGLLSGICISQMNLLMFAMNNCYPYIRLNLGLPNTMAMFGIMSLLGKFLFV